MSKSLVVLFFFTGFLLRVGLIMYGMYQDKVMNLRYTDIDYDVYNDASRYIVDGESPYRRATYRYTPLLAEMLIPDVTLNEEFGKILFCVFDVVIGALQYQMLRQTLSVMWSLVYTSIWIFNPMSIVISTRGNAEAVVCLFVILTFYFLYKRKIYLCSFFFGLAVHMKIYPVLYAFPILFALDAFFPNKSFFSKERFLFPIVSFGTFALLTAFYYYRYGFQFLWETYLYHATRTDHRHNLSVYWYYLSLAFDFPKSTVRSLISFLPQILCLVAVAIKYCKKDIIFCGYLMTCIFVCFNKVYTMQYFIWWFVLLPFVVPKIVKGALHHIVLTITVIAMYVASYGVWLYYGYQLEFMGENSMFEIYCAGLFVFVMNILLICWHVYVYTLSEKLETTEKPKTH
ncbi:GPI mannosyltransferase, putative [Entamoeba invadens IP1]|uniref:GPI mannosyltransferase 1 n=1 Tax=Entamoeba invadens IP1 TaxID=370355 RepID=A0A0A1UG18_ENTIV|nr:GPI mannosyltransferase, putative [Entamoeba invadens IP1]ELP92144.1 GPI mannosyltransferase, putative [Entamoeba invadens IP1]|eukprot:XP_004258915.1 GPI mannosyltransferase, putative [Entamoeba invadens IP1]